MHKIRMTGKVNLEGRTWELELTLHHYGRDYIECEADCPEGWQIPTYWLLQSMRNDPKTRKKFGLLYTFEHVQNPDDISRKMVMLIGLKVLTRGLACITI